MTRSRTETTVQVAFRFPASLLKRIDAYRKKLGHDTRLKVTRADAVRALVQMALDQGSESKP